ncbi:MAG TPA: energy-coupling factor transporter transmembrane protein EcfT [Bacteroidetes bacterium]|nr:energy-coupling factor transporter transmembrane protein EcfT [Bacteroidota bacterium]HEX04921.1 energy-coupling factor transporter transmembrane protein EcfT [Bacteroidota bacterium]
MNDDTLNVDLKMGTTSASFSFRLSHLDARARLLCGIGLIVQVVLIPPDESMLLLALLIVLFIIAGRPPLARLAFGLVAIVWMLVLTVLLHAFTTSGHILWTVPVVGWMMTIEGLQNGALLAGRLSAIVLLGVTLSLSVSALEAIRAMDVLLSPLARMRIPVGTFSLLIGMTLRFVPSLYEEALTLRKALRARGWDPGKGIIARVRAWIPLFIPLLANALRRADDLAETLVLRGYDPHAVRTSHGMTAWSFVDSLALALTLSPLALWITQISIG